MGLELLNGGGEDEGFELRPPLKRSKIRLFQADSSKKDFI